MYALVENNQFVKIVNSSKGITIGDNQYPKSIYSLWSNAEREAIGIYEVVVDNTNLKDQEYWINTNITYTYADGTVTGSYGTATAKPLDDVLFVEGDEIPSDKQVGDIKQYGLKGQKISIIKQQAAGLLAPTDWQVIKEVETSDYVVPTSITEYRAAVRTASNDMEAKINAAADVDALKVLYEYTETDGVVSRPLGEFPKEIE